MPKYTRGVEPVAFFIGTEPVLRKYVGSVLVWDGTRSAVAQALAATAIAAVRPAVASVSITATASAATAAAGANTASASASAGGLASAATATALVLDHVPHATATATTTAATATAVVNAAVADENFDAVANAIAATASAAVSAATGSADAMATATPATATTIVYDAHGAGSMSVAATAAAATAAVPAPQMSASATATAIAATAAAAGNPATPSTGSTVPATAATATATVVTATGSTGRTYSDDMNRANNASMGADYRVDRNASPQINTNKAQMKTQAFGEGRAGCWVSYQGGSDSGRLASDRYAVELQLAAPVGNLATNNMTGGVLAVGDTFGDGVMCYFVVTTANGCAIYTQSGLPPTSGISTGQTGQTQRAVTATNAATTDLFKFERDGNLFTLYRNGSTFLTWDDTGALVSSGSSYRRFGFFVEGNYPFQAYASPAVDSIAAYDL
ncbi:hypothetical protein ATM97_07180 [Nocardia sp. MH4]|uniref:hypothetical protein n=1 Tax=Nocardia sp. MH4 TaxID=1768677 RepID=UPI001C4E3BE9|nr:hypothetical protein [Nocardia sp. MH4]MBW0270794.1 hypothetical protein [Nocardia sp. MH4]